MFLTLVFSSTYLSLEQSQGTATVDAPPAVSHFDFAQRIKRVPSASAMLSTSAPVFASTSTAPVAQHLLLLPMLLVASLSPTFLPSKCSRTFPFQLQAYLVNSLLHHHQPLFHQLPCRQLVPSKALMFCLMYSVHTTSCQKMIFQRRRCSDTFPVI